ncbi:MAG: carbohydrate kinase [Microbacteriaceae bacterium]|nr:carbohydrate kinase [Microbacteriaceae bacterium]
MGSIGDNVVDRYYDTGLMYPGGGAVNVAVHSSRFGCEACYIGIIGSDSSGEHVTTALRAEGIDLAFARFVPEPNAATDVSIDERGNRAFVDHWAANSVIQLTTEDLRHLRGCTWLYTNYSSGIDAQVPALAGIAPLAFDFSYKDLDYAASLLPYVSIAAFSRDGFSEKQSISFIRSVLKFGPETVIVTLGANGVVIGSGSEIYVGPAEKIVPVDTLGAGDAFLARFVSGLFAGESIPTAASSASKSAADVCLHHGAFGYPRQIPTAREYEHHDL